MPLPQLRHTMQARKYGAFFTSASAMHGSARFDNADDAQAFVAYLENEYQVYMFAQGNVTAVDWTRDRMVNGHVTPIRSESKS